MASIITNLEGFMTLALILLILALTINILVSAKKKLEWERRILAVVLFFTVHKLAFFLEEPIISQLTDMLFVISLLYALMYVFAFEKKISSIEEQRKEFLTGLEEIRNIKEIREKLKK